jgi:hypothetical protein
MSEATPPLPPCLHVLNRGNFTLLRSPKYEWNPTFLSKIGNTFMILVNYPKKTREDKKKKRISKE